MLRQARAKTQKFFGSFFQKRTSFLSPVRQSPSPLKPATNRLRGIEAARGIAACLVVFYHAARHMDAACHMPLLRRLFQSGHAGVDVFFVLSGFIILFVHAGDVGRPARLGHYAWRRFSRVIPVYWVALGFTLVLAAFAGHGWPAIGRVLYSASLLPSWSEPLLGVAWTLQYELVFYAAFALLILDARAGLACFAVWLAGIAACAFGLIATPLPPSLLSTYNVEFFFGMGAALALRRWQVPGWIGMLGSVLFAAACLAESTNVLDGYGRAARLAYGFPAALVVAGLAQARFVWRGLSALGAASYSIYLFQFCLIGAAWQVLRHADCDIGMPALSAAAIVGGILFSRTIEYPLMQAVRKRT